MVEKTMFYVPNLLPLPYMGFPSAANLLHETNFSRHHAGDQKGAGPHDGNLAHATAGTGQKAGWCRRYTHGQTSVFDELFGKHEHRAGCDESQGCRMRQRSDIEFVAKATDPLLADSTILADVPRQKAPTPARPPPFLR